MTLARLFFAALGLLLATAPAPAQTPAEDLERCRALVSDLEFQLDVNRANLEFENRNLTSLTNQRKDREGFSHLTRPLDDAIFESRFRKGQYADQIPNLAVKITLLRRKCDWLAAELGIYPPPPPPKPTGLLLSIIRDVRASMRSAERTLAASKQKLADIERRSGISLQTTAPSRINWAGPYVGFQAGGGWMRGDANVNSLQVTNNLRDFTVPLDPSGFVAGVLGGYRWRNGRFVYGGEVDLSVANVRDASTVKPLFNLAGTVIPNAMLQAEQRMKFLSTARIVAGGVPDERVFVYATAGFGLAQFDIVSNLTAPPGPAFLVTDRVTKGGWVAGGGIEWAATERVSYGVRFLHVDCGDLTYIANPTPFQPNSQIRTTLSGKGNIFIFEAKIDFGGSVERRSPMPGGR